MTEKVKSFKTMSNNLFILFNNKMSQKSPIIKNTNRPSNSSNKGGKSGGSGENAKNNKSVTTRGPNVRGGSTSSSSPKTTKITNGGRPSSSGGRKIASNTTKGGFVGPYEQTKQRSKKNESAIGDLKSEIGDLKKKIGKFRRKINVLEKDRDYSKTHVMWMRRVLINLMIRSSDNAEQLETQLKTIDYKGLNLSLIVSNNDINYAFKLIDNKNFDNFNNLNNYLNDTTDSGDPLFKLVKSGKRILMIEHIKPVKTSQPIETHLNQ
jgi:hypothetical protein